MTNSSVRARRGGFTLIELLAAMAILSLLIGLALTMVSKARATGNKTACSLQLRDIAVVMQDYVDHRKDGKWPKERGIKFLLTVVRDDVIRGEDLKKFACPGTDDITARSDSDPVGSGIKDWEDLDPECISYAGRDNVAFPLKKDRLSEEILASDDNMSAGAGRANHAGITNVVYADGHVGTIETSKYKGELPDPEQDWLPVGPESPDENLRKLAVD
jgi:prepilin-type N-terminal cleavage/methylation domain-containing protein/prepilin-type processing-associated H-X9-DG protein